MKICGHILPERLVELTDKGRWNVPDNCGPLSELLGEEFLNNPHFYSPAIMERETQWTLLRGLPDEWVAEHGEEKARKGLALWLDMWCGHEIPADEQRPGPGRIEPSQAVFIGDGGQDAAIALYYSKPGVRPSVIYPACVTKTTWVQVAPDFDTFAERLGL